MAWTPPIASLPGPQTMSTEQRIRVALVDDDEVYRRTVEQEIAVDGFECVGLFAGVEDFLDSALVAFDVLLLDIELKTDRSGIDWIGEIRTRFPTGEIVMLTGLADEQLLFDALRSGATGYLYKGQNVPARFLDRIREAHAGGSPMTPGIARMVVAHMSTVAHEFGNLTAKEREVLTFVVQGKTNAQIAPRLGIGADGVAHHIKNIYKRLQVNTRAALIFEFYQNTERVKAIRPQVHIECDKAAYRVDERIRATVRLSVDKARKTVSIRLLVVVPRGLTIDSLPEAKPGEYDPDTSIWAVEIEPRATARLECGLRGRHAGEYLIQACVAQCSVPIRAVSGAVSISVS